MAGASLLMLLDDIASILDDVSVLAKVAVRKTAGVVGDDLAVNAYQVNGVLAERELPVVWAVARGSFVNKAILVPAALLISAIASWAIVPLLMLGGAFLCYEGAEKLNHYLSRGATADRPRASEARAERLRAAPDASIDRVAEERRKIRGAIRTDFILSAEIIIITLGVVADSDLGRQVAVLATIAIAMTVGVYGLVAAIVKFDDLGLHLSQRAGADPVARGLRTLGRGILAAAPWLLKGLTVVGTAAMFLVGGSILLHGFPALEHAVIAWLPKGFGESGIALLVSALLGIVVGMLLTGGHGVAARLFGRTD